MRESRRGLRGCGLGAASLLTDEHMTPAPRQEHTYRCARGHTGVVTLSAEVDVPSRWDCRCGAAATFDKGANLDVDLDVDVAAGRPGRTPWEMLLDRRTIPELEELLQERLRLLRSGALGSSLVA